MEYPSKELAEAALYALNGFNLDKNHVFRVYSFSMLDTLKEPDQNWKEPTPNQYVDVVSYLRVENEVIYFEFEGDLWWYVQNPKCFDQFAIQVHDRKGDELTTAVYWANNGKDPSIIEAKKV